MKTQLFSTKTLKTSLVRDVAAIALPKGRRVGTEGHARVLDFLVGRLGELGCIPYAGDSFRLPYEREGISFCNAVGVLPGRDRSLPPLLVGAHYDSVIDAPCADDNAAAVAIALAAAEMSAGSLERDLVVAIFDAEEPPHFMSESMGSERFYHDQRDERGFHAAIIMDLVGHDVSLTGKTLTHIPGIGPLLGRLPGFKNKDISLPLLHPLLFITGAESHPMLSSVLDTVGPQDGLKIVSTLNRYIGDMSDHGVFRKNGVPYFFLSCGRWEHYHSPTDTPDRLNYRKMASITRQVAALLGELDSQELERTGNKETISETLEMEVASLRSSLSVLWPYLLRRAGLEEVRTRKDMDKLVGEILSFGL
jgi:hypothetical protein